jgi:hypothetical protein
MNDDFLLAIDTNVNFTTRAAETIAAASIQLIFFEG